MTVRPFDNGKGLDGAKGSRLAYEMTKWSLGDRKRVGSRGPSTPGMKGSGAGRRIADRWRLGQKTGAGWDGLHYCDNGVPLVAWNCGSVGKKKALLHCKIGIAWSVLWHQK